MGQNSFQQVYERLYSYFGPQGWWPAETPIEVIIGAVLTQNTNWGNVEKAITNMKTADLMSVSKLQSLPIEELAEYIRPSGYFNRKAKRLKNLFQMLENEYEGELDFFLKDSLQGSRENLLSVSGVGPETADSILLYAAQKPVFVIDTYTYRVFSRHQLVEEESDYHRLQQDFMDQLPEDVAIFNEYHALIVAVAKKFCKKTNPHCEECPLRRVGEVNVI